MQQNPMGQGVVAMAIALVLVATLASPLAAQIPAVSSPAASVEVSRGLNDGALRAESVGTGGYFAGGFVSGLFLGLIGTGITYAVASSSDVSIPATERVILADKSPEYLQGYQSAFTQRVRQKRKEAGLIGGLLGTVLLVVAVASS